MNQPVELDAMYEAARHVYAHMSSTPQYAWPLLAERCGCEVWVKHENHTPIGAFKVRGGLNYLARLKEEQPCITSVISATRGNHGQSIGFAARALGMRATILVPHGNNPEKNAAMRALGVTLIEHGDDFQEAAEHARTLAASDGHHMIPPFHPWLIAGVCSYGLEFMRAVENMDAIIVAVGMGSGICSLIRVRDALGLKTRIYGVVAENAPSYALSFREGKVVTTDSADTLADGVACRSPDDAALQIMLDGAAEIITVSDDEILAAMGHYYTDTHNVAEGAAAAPLAALLQRRNDFAGKRVGLIHSGGNADAALLRRALELLT
ncbi:MAG: threonine dehydratase [Alphaproteobacteria bacterium]